MRFLSIAEVLDLHERLLADSGGAPGVRDPGAVSIFDDAHSGRGDRWITLGISAGGGVLVVHHTFEELNAQTVRIRIFSSRKATRNEAGQYRK